MACPFGNFSLLAVDYLIPVPVVGGGHLAVRWVSKKAMVLLRPISYLETSRLESSTDLPGRFSFRHFALL